MKFTYSKTKAAKAGYQKLESNSGMLSVFKAVFCCFDFRRVYTAVMDHPIDAPYNSRDIFYANNAPTQPIFVFA